MNKKELEETTKRITEQLLIRLLFNEPMTAEENLLLKIFEDKEEITCFQNKCRT